MAARDVIALDGEGVNPDGEGGPHWYTLLNAYDSRYQKHRYIQQWGHGGLDTEYILRFLCWLRRGRDTIVCTYYGNYDVTMWLKDLDDETKTALWRGGWTVWRAPSGQTYWLEYVPSKTFFVGVYRQDMGLRYNRYRWPTRHLLVYDVSGFAQQSFARTLREWGIGGDRVATIEQMKEARRVFTADQRDAITAYNRAECIYLAEYVRQLDATFQSEGVRLHSWHGGGALASHYLSSARVSDHLREPPESEARKAVMYAYFGGRNELAQMGHFQQVFDYDLHSAYPAACLALPDLACGSWRHATRYEPFAQFAAWHVRWNLPNVRIGPFPLRYKRGVYYPSAGSGWYHAVELQAAIRHYGPLRAGVLDVTDGWTYDPASASSPFQFVQDLAARRVQYKTSDPKRATPYRLGLNSLYGKLAQHTFDPARLPRWQCYAAAGYVTAATRARLLDMIYADGSDGRDVVMLATDGIFTTSPRTNGVGSQLGEWDAKGTVADIYIIQPGVWYGRAGGVRSRGFGVRSLDYERIRLAWERAGPKASIPYVESRFIGLGTCAGLGNFANYGKWLEVRRDLSFFPDRKFPEPWAPGTENVRLVPMDFSGRESEIYEPAKERDPSGSTILLERLERILAHEDMPDLDGEAVI